MTTNRDEKTVTLSFAEFKDMSTQVAAELCAVINEPKFIILSAILCARISDKLFEGLEIEEKQ